MKNRFDGRDTRYVGVDEKNRVRRREIQLGYLNSLAGLLFLFKMKPYIFDNWPGTIYFHQITLSLTEYARRQLYWLQF